MKRTAIIIWRLFVVVDFVDLGGTFQKNICQENSYKVKKCVFQPYLSKYHSRIIFVLTKNKDQFIIYKNYSIGFFRKLDNFWDNGYCCIFPRDSCCLFIKEYQFQMNPSLKRSCSLQQTFIKIYCWIGLLAIVKLFLPLFKI